MEKLKCISNENEEMNPTNKHKKEETDNNKSYSTKTNTPSSPNGRKNKLYYKKETKTYTKESIFNQIDIEESLNKNKSIPFIDKEHFFYNKDLEKNYDSMKWKKLNDKISELTHTFNLEKINSLSKVTSILLSEMIFENSNGHKYHFLDKYMIMDVIGEGSFGLVLKCWCRTTKKRVSVKIISKKNREKETLKYFEMERKYLVGLNNNNILQIFEVEENEQYLVLILELMEWCTLKQLMIQRFIEKKCFTEKEISVIIKNIINGLNYMHINKVMHRDIKPENIMFKDYNDLNSLRIIDLGLATSFESHKVKKFCGTIKFMAPEILENKSYDQSVDIWACGIILYLLCSGGMHPLNNHFKINNAQMFKNNLLKEKGKWRFNDGFPLLARNLFLNLCQFDSIKRYATFEALKHPWITRNNQDQIPLTILQKYNRKKLVKSFKEFLLTAVAIEVLKKSIHGVNLLVKTRSKSETKINIRKKTNGSQYSMMNCNIIKEHLKSNPLGIKSQNSHQILRINSNISNISNINNINNINNTNINTTKKEKPQKTNFLPYINNKSKLKTNTIINNNIQNYIPNIISNNTSSTNLTKKKENISKKDLLQIQINANNNVNADNKDSVKGKLFSEIKISLVGNKLNSPTKTVYPANLSFNINSESDMNKSRLKLGKNLNIEALNKSPNKLFYYSNNSTINYNSENTDNNIKLNGNSNNINIFNRSNANFHSSNINLFKIKERSDTTIAAIADNKNNAKNNINSSILNQNKIDKKISVEINSYNNRKNSKDYKNNKDITKRKAGRSKTDLSVGIKHEVGSFSNIKNNINYEVSNIRKERKSTVINLNNDNSNSNIQNSTQNHINNLKGEYNKSNLFLNNQANISKLVIKRKNKGNYKFSNIFLNNNNSP